MTATVVQSLFSFASKEQYVFGVTSIGDVFRNQSDEILGSIDTRECANGVLTPEEFRQWGLFLPEDHAITKKVERACEESRLRRARALLSVNEFNILVRIEILQRINDERWRIYGGLMGSSVLTAKPSIVLVTEFKEFVDGETARFWEQLNALAPTIQAEVRTIDEGNEIEHSWKAGADLRMIPGTETFGPNHNRPYRQVEFAWEIHEKTPQQVRQLIKSMSIATQPLWDQAGVGVL